MKRSLLTLIFATAAIACSAAPNLLTAPYPATGPQPSSATMTVNGGAPQACLMRGMPDGAVQPACDLAAITTPGVYTIVVTAVALAGCTNGPNTATCSAGGSVSSDPFSYVLKAALAGKPVLSVTP